MERRPMRPPSTPHRARPPFCRTVLRVWASLISPAMVYTSTVALFASLRIIVVVVSVSDVNTVNLGSTIG